MHRDDILLKCLEIEWQDHFNTRAQTWKTLEIEAMLAVALVGIDWQLDSIFATSAVAVLLILAALSGSAITYRHRNNVEVMKFSHIINIEEKLGLCEPDLFGDVRKPAPIEWWHVLYPKSNTPLFILRMNIIFMVFGIIYLVFRLV